jgi:glycosyltransferase involved in cell wall biosynthesis
MPKKSSEKLAANIRVAIIGSVGIPGNYGGFETFIENLTRELNGRIPITVYCSARSYPVRLEKHNGAILKYLPLNANGLQSIPYDVLSLFLAARNNDSILILGASGCLALPLFRLFYPHKRLIVNLDGLEHMREKWNRFIRYFLKVSERTAMQHADEIIADNPVISQYYLSEYGKESTLITYGGDQAGNLSLSDSIRLKYSIPERYAFGVCRIEPENNVHLILEAFTRSSIPLVMIGNWESTDLGRKLRLEYGSSENIRMISAIYDQGVLDQIRSNCRIYIHGHSAGGTNPSLVEAMNLSLPVFAFDAEFNREATFGKAKYFSTAAELRGMLTKTGLGELAGMGAEMGRIAREHYLWMVIAEKYARVLTVPDH